MPVGKILDTEVRTDNKTIGFYVGIAVIGFFIGLNFSKMQANDEMQKVQHSFALDEITGLRNDMNREVLLLRKELEDIKKKIDK